MDFSEFVKKVRKDMKVSQADLAKALSVNFTTINRWENNRVVPSNLAMKSFADYCQNNFIEVPEEFLKQSE